MNIRSEAGCGGKSKHVIIRCSQTLEWLLIKCISASDWKKQLESAFFFFLLFLCFYPQTEVWCLNKPLLLSWERAGRCHVRCELNVSPPQRDLSCEDTCELREASGERNYPFASVTASNLNTWDTNRMEATDWRPVFTLITWPEAPCCLK